MVYTLKGLLSSVKNDAYLDKVSIIWKLCCLFPRNLPMKSLIHLDVYVPYIHVHLSWNIGEDMYFALLLSEAFLLTKIVYH